jgi:hypothetical protein
MKQVIFIRKNIFIIISLIVILGCSVGPWVKAGGLYKSRYYNYSVELPEGWMRLNTDRSLLLITRDGIPLQSIGIKVLDINEELKYTKKKLKKDMLPQEAAEIIIQNTSSTPTILNFEVLENSPTKLSGFPGFKLVTTNNDKYGLKSRSIFYGFIIDEWFYCIQYNAAQRYYFDKDIKTFEKVFESFKITQIGFSLW